MTVIAGVDVGNATSVLTDPVALGARLRLNDHEAGPAGDEELLGVLARSRPHGAAVGRGDVGGGLETCAGESLGHRYAVALGLALAGGR